MIQDVEKITHDVLQVFREENSRTLATAERYRDQLKHEMQEHGKTERRLRRSVAFLVLACDQTSKAGRRPGMLPTYTIEFLNFLNPNRNPNWHHIVEEDREWAQGVLANIKANFDRPPEQVPESIKEEAVCVGS